MASDRRIQYTKQIIKESFFKLLHQSHIEEISVKALCAEADINRATFYRHYKDIYDLFETIERELCAEIEADVIRDMIDIRALTKVYEYQVFYREFFHTNLLLSLIKERNQFQYEEELSKAQQKDGFDAIQFKYSFDFLVYGLHGLLKDWVENGCPETPEEFAKILKDIVL
ncbi:MAG: hypothetical protein BEN18_04000 [Epulopiscium sp. Nuni2H_MBin001]|nr:MAG: hypothetical protein BEN18_04000 [Epulopiscium sp. Nuni2H_MBin001]